VAPKALAKWSSTTDSVANDAVSSFDGVGKGQNLPSDRAKCSSIESAIGKEKTRIFFSSFMKSF
jgi:hypothetical protein